MKIGVIGTGYVGLVSGTCFADSGNDVICVDIDEKKVEKMRNGEVPIYEPGLNRVFDRSIREKRLSFTTDLEDTFQKERHYFSLSANTSRSRRAGRPEFCTERSR
jgi:UDPglucose 6-dehydrogenase